MRVATTVDGTLLLRLPLQADAPRAGAVVAELNDGWLKEVQRELESRASAEQLGLFLLDANGRIRHANQRMADGGGKAMVDWLLAARRQADAAVRDWPDGGAYLTAVVVATGSDAARQLDWAVAARRPASQVFDGADQLVMLILLLGAVCVAVAGALIWFMLQR